MKILSFLPLRRAPYRKQAGWRNVSTLPKRFRRWLPNVPSSFRAKTRQKRHYRQFFSIGTIPLGRFRCDFPVSGGRPRQRGALLLSRDESHDFDKRLPTDQYAADYGTCLRLRENFAGGRFEFTKRGSWAAAPDVLHCHDQQRGCRSRKRAIAGRIWQTDPKVRLAFRW